MNYDYYIAKGRSLAAVQEYLALRKSYHDAVRAVLTEFGVEDTNTLFTVGDRIVGVGAQAVLPDCLKQNRDDPECYLPNGRTKSGRGLGRRLRALDRPNESHFYTALCGEPLANVVRVGNKLNMTGYGAKVFGEATVLSCIEGGHPPYDAEPLPRSAYWKMREAAESGSGAAAT